MDQRSTFSDDCSDEFPVEETEIEIFFGTCPVPKKRRRSNSPDPGPSGGANQYQCQPPQSEAEKRFLPKSSEQRILTTRKIPQCVLQNCNGSNNARTFTKPEEFCAPCEQSPRSPQFIRPGPECVLKSNQGNENEGPVYLELQDCSIVKPCAEQAPRGQVLRCHVPPENQQYIEKCTEIRQNNAFCNENKPVTLKATDCECPRHPCHVHRKKICRVKRVSPCKEHRILHPQNIPTCQQKTSRGSTCSDSSAGTSSEGSNCSGSSLSGPPSEKCPPRQADPCKIEPIETQYPNCCQNRPSLTQYPYQPMGMQGQNYFQASPSQTPYPFQTMGTPDQNFCQARSNLTQNQYPPSNQCTKSSKTIETQTPTPDKKSSIIWKNPVAANSDMSKQSFEPYDVRTNTNEAPTNSKLKNKSKTGSAIGSSEKIHKEFRLSLDLVTPHNGSFNKSRNESAKIPDSISRPEDLSISKLSSISGTSNDSSIHLRNSATKSTLPQQPSSFLELGYNNGSKVMRASKIPYQSKEPTDRLSGFENQRKTKELLQQSDVELLQKVTKEDPRKPNEVLRQSDVELLQKITKEDQRKPSEVLRQSDVELLQKLTEEDLAKVLENLPPDANLQTVIDIIRKNSDVVSKSQVNESIPSKRSNPMQVTPTLQNSVQNSTATNNNPASYSPLVAPTNGRNVAEFVPMQRTPTLQNSVQNSTATNNNPTNYSPFVAPPNGRNFTEFVPMQATPTLKNSVQNPTATNNNPTNYSPYVAPPNGRNFTEFVPMQATPTLQNSVQNPTATNNNPTNYSSLVAPPNGRNFVEIVNAARSGNKQIPTTTPIQISAMPQISRQRESAQNCNCCDSQITFQIVDMSVCASSNSLLQIPTSSYPCNGAKINQPMKSSTCLEAKNLLLNAQKLLLDAAQNLVKNDTCSTGTCKSTDQPPAALCGPSPGRAFQAQTCIVACSSPIESTRSLNTSHKRRFGPTLNSKIPVKACQTFKATPMPNFYRKQRNNFDKFKTTTNTGPSKIPPTASIANTCTSLCDCVAHIEYILDSYRNKCGGMQQQNQRYGNGTGSNEQGRTSVNQNMLNVLADQNRRYSAGNPKDVLNWKITNKIGSCNHNFYRPAQAQLGMKYRNQPPSEVPKDCFQNRPQNFGQMDQAQSMQPKNTGPNTGRLYNGPGQINCSPELLGNLNLGDSHFQNLTSFQLGFANGTINPKQVSEFPQGPFRNLVEAQNNGYQQQQPFNNQLSERTEDQKLSTDQQLLLNQLLANGCLKPQQVNPNLACNFPTGEYLPEDGIFPQFNQKNNNSNENPMLYTFNENTDKENPVVQALLERLLAGDLPPDQLDNILNNKPQLPPKKIKAEEQSKEKKKLETENTKRSSRDSTVSKDSSSKGSKGSSGLGKSAALRKHKKGQPRRSSKDSPPTSPENGSDDLQSQKTFSGESATLPQMSTIKNEWGDKRFDFEEKPDSKDNLPTAVLKSLKDLPEGSCVKLRMTVKETTEKESDLLKVCSKEDQKTTGSKDIDHNSVCSKHTSCSINDSAVETISACLRDQTAGPDYSEPSCSGVLQLYPPKMPFSQNQCPLFGNPNYMYPNYYPNQPGHGYYPNNQMGNCYNDQNQLGNFYNNQNQLGNFYNHQNQLGNSCKNQNQLENCYNNQSQLGNSYTNQNQLGNSYTNQNQLGNSYNSQNQLGNSYTNQNQLGNSYNNQNQSGHFPMDGPSSPSRGFGVNENYFSSRDFKDGEDKAQADNCGTECKPQRTSGKVSNTSSCDGSTSDRCLNMGIGTGCGNDEIGINPIMVNLTTSKCRRVKRRGSRRKRKTNKPCTCPQCQNLCCPQCPPCCCCNVPTIYEVEM